MGADMAKDIDDGGPAFPQTRFEVDSEGGSSLETTYGMTLRDWFAGQALMGECARLASDRVARRLASAADDSGDLPEQILADWCFKLADAMLSARSPKQEG